MGFVTFRGLLSQLKLLCTSVVSKIQNHYLLCIFLELSRNQTHFIIAGNVDI
ncbi:hypothetical protein AXX17_AT1G44040 [Arabidopsis thaliana]|uniref:Uncharacterized protein n=1 Tax=Arabidopsis thaliana TaxID=3702 RepID=A0A178WCP5_ARATH|nr:hypothetical protein AXX17_AT1G44040 [Arabidopsis thaliana]